MSEETLLDERGVTVTRTRAVLNGTTYPVNGITSVGLRRGAVSGFPALLGVTAVAALLFAGLFGFVGARAVFDPEISPEAAVYCFVGPALAAGTVGVVAGLLAAIGARAPRPWIVVLGTAGGDRRALVTSDEDFAHRVKAAIEQAVEQRG